MKRLVIPAALHVMMGWSNLLPEDISLSHFMLCSVMLVSSPLTQRLVRLSEK